MTIVMPANDSSNRDSLPTAFERARQQLDVPAPRAPRAAAAVPPVQARRTRPADRLAIRVGGKVSFVVADQIQWIEAAGNYVRIHTTTGEQLARETMGSIHAKLDPDEFLRIHRSTIVRADVIKEIHPWFHGDRIVVLSTGQRLILTRTHRRSLERLLGR